MDSPGDGSDDFFVIGNYHLFAGSLCTNGGANNSVPALCATGFDLEEKIF